MIAKVGRHGLFAYQDKSRRARQPISVAPEHSGRSCPGPASTRAGAWPYEHRPAPPGGQWRETSVPIADLGYVVRQLEGEPDVYLTQNRFFGRRRLVSQLAELDALFVDLDYYKTAHADDHPRHVLSLAVDALELARIPPPSFAVASGRGLALVWLHHPVPRPALPRWRACQQVLWHTLRHLGADRLASDAARVLRLVGTRNSRSQTLVECVTPVGEAWDFDLLADEILPLPRAELIALRLERARRRAGGQGLSKGKGYRPLPAGSTAPACGSCASPSCSSSSITAGSAPCPTGSGIRGCCWPAWRSATWCRHPWSGARS